ncbi:vibriolysin, partial [Dokdonella immobilis]
MIKSNCRGPVLVALTPLVLSILAASASAATRTDLHQQNVEGLNRSYAAATQTLGIAASSSERHAEALGFDSESTLRALESSVDSDGTRHYRYQQYFRGIPVWGEHVVVAEDGRGNLKSLFGRSVGGLAMEIPMRAPVVGAN